MVSVLQVLSQMREIHAAHKSIKVTKVSGYVDTPIPKKCGTCHYLSHDHTECDNKVVNRDPEVPNGPTYKKVSAENGCCNEWEPR